MLWSIVFVLTHNVIDVAGLQKPVNEIEELYGRRDIYHSYHKNTDLKLYSVPHRKSSHSSRILIRKKNLITVLLGYYRNYDIVLFGDWKFKSLSVFLVWKAELFPNMIPSCS